MGERPEMDKLKQHMKWSQQKLTLITIFPLTVKAKHLIILDTSSPMYIVQLEKFFKEANRSQGDTKNYSYASWPEKPKPPNPPSPMSQLSLLSQHIFP